MAYSDRQARKARKDSGGDNPTTFTASRSLPGSARGSLDVSRRPIEMRRGSSEDGGVGAFAREVVITGHKVVGGKTWTDKARMGAYVGGFELRSQLPFTKPSDLVRRCVSAEENSIRDRDNHSLGEFWRWPLQHDRWQSRCLIYVLQGGTINLLRRYTDFVRLRNALKSTYPVCRAHIPWDLEDEVSSSLTACRSICTTLYPNSRAKLICVSTPHRWRPT